MLQHQYLCNSGNILILIREETHPTTVTPNTMTLLAALGWLAIIIPQFVTKLPVLLVLPNLWITHIFFGTPLPE